MSTDPRARRNALVLAISQAVVGSATPVSISLGALAGHFLLGPDKSLATAPVTAQNLGLALGTLPAAWLMRSFGRKVGFHGGTFVTGLAGLIATLALFRGSFWLFAAGMALVGIGAAFVQQYRFAAADSAPIEDKPKAISMVLAGGVFSAIVGPQTVIWTRDLFAPVMFAGAFAAIIVLAMFGAFVLTFLDLPKEEAAHAASESTGRPLSVIVSQPRFIVAMVSGVSSYALMSFVMTGAPLAMVGCGFTPDEATLGISWHVLAMFAPSFFTGHLIARFGKEAIVAVGLVLLAGSGLVALSGLQLWQFWGSLILLGVGWNFAFIGATSMVADCYAPAEKNKVQGIHDFILFSIVAFSSLMSGWIYNTHGWAMLNWVIFPFVMISLIAVGYLVSMRPPAVR